MNDQIAEIKKRIDIVNFIGGYTNLKKTGRNFKANCPFHSEKTPSFVVSPERQIWRCFGSCADGGDVIKFLMKWENITFVEAVRELAVKVGVKLKDAQDFEDRAWRKKERLININTLAAEFFNYILFKNDLGKKALDYLSARQVNTKIADKFQLGYAPSSWDSLLKFLKKKGFGEEEIAEAGLTVQGERGGYYDRFRGRLIFPIKDNRANVIAFAGRSLEEGKHSSKYINTPETLLYKKRESLYGIDVARDAIKKEKNVILVEGEFDVITPYAHGIENIVATKGTAVTREQLLLLKRYTDRVILSLDQDAAGEEAARRTIEEAENLDLEVDIMTFDYAKDPDEAVRSDLTKFKKAIKSKVPVYDYIIDIMKKKYPEDDPYSKKKIGDEVVTILERIKNPIVQSHYIKRLAGFLDVSESSVEMMIRRRTRAKKQRLLVTAASRDEEGDRLTNLEKYILSRIFQSRDPYKLEEKVFKIISVDGLSQPSHKKIIDALGEYKKGNTSFNLNSFYDLLPSQLHHPLDEIYLYASSEAQLHEENIERLAYEIRKLSLKKQMSVLMSDGATEDKNKLKDLSTSLKEVEKKLVSL